MFLTIFVATNKVKTLVNSTKMKKIILALLASVLMSACCADCYKRSPKIGELEQATWKMVDFNNQAIGGANITAKFDANEKMFYAQGDCNNYFASYYLEHKEEGGIKFGTMGGSMRLCPDTDTTIEEKFVQSLPNVRRLVMEGERLMMLNENGNLIAVFEQEQ